MSESLSMTGMQPWYIASMSAGFDNVNPSRRTKQNVASCKTAGYKYVTPELSKLQRTFVDVEDLQLDNTKRDFECLFSKSLNGALNLGAI